MESRRNNGRGKLGGMLAARMRERLPEIEAAIATRVYAIADPRVGIHTVTAIPKIAGGAGSVTHFELDFGRRFEYRGEKRSYLTASCPSGKYYAEAQALFGDGTLLHIEHILPCTPAI